MAQSTTGPTPAVALSLVRPVVMIGLMGAGKSSVGLKLAELLGAEFRDSDTEIEGAANMTIPEIFSAYGEPHFRDGERRVIARLLGEGPKVLATGGGAFMTPQTREVIAEQAVSVWLNADLDLLVQRTIGRTHRPLLNQGKPRDVLAGLIKARYPVYAQADVQVLSRPGLSHEQMARRIITRLLAHGARTGKGALARESE